MSVDRKISDLNPYPGDGKPQGGDLFLSAREDNTNFKIPFSGLSRYGAEFAKSVFTTGDQTIDGQKTFNEFIVGNVSGNLSGTAKYVEHGVYTTGDQTIDGQKTFNEFIIGNVSGNLSGTARYVQDGVYVTGDQTIDGQKTFNEIIVGNLSGTAKYVEHGVYLTGDQLIGGNKTFLNPISGDLSGISRYVQDGVYTTGDQNINGIKTFSSFINSNVSGNLSGIASHVENGVYITGNQDITGVKNFIGDLLVSGCAVLTQENFGESVENVVYATGDQIISGRKTFEDNVVLTGIISNNSEPLILTDGRNPSLFQTPDNSLTMAFQNDVYITGGVGGDLTDLHVEGTIYANQIDAVSEIVGEEGSMVFTDGRDPALFEGPDNSLTMAFQNDVYITGGVGGDLTDLHVEGTIYANQIDAVSEIVGEEGSMVFTDGRDPALFEGPDNSLTMAFQNDVYITGGVGGASTDHHVEGTIYANQIDAVSEIVGEEGSMVFTDGRDPALFEGPDNSLTMAFQNDVYITGGVGGASTDHHVEGTIYANQIDAVSEIVGEEGSMVFTDGRDPALFEGPDNSLTMAFQNDVYITGGVGGDLADLHVEGTIYANQIDAVSEIIGESGSMVLTDGRDPSLFEGPDNSLSLAFSSGVYITGEIPEEGNLYVQNSGYFSGLHAENIVAKTFTVESLREVIKKE